MSFIARYKISGIYYNYLRNLLSEEEIVSLNIPTGVPLVYEFDSNWKCLGKQYLGDQEAIAKKAQAVANQGKA